MKKNIVETFNKFNGGCRRPNRREHLRLCGWTLWRQHLPDQGERVSVSTMRILDGITEETGKYYHVVTLPAKDADGWTYYNIYRKEI